MALLFRWEDSPSLEHHCGFCHQSLNHPKTKSTCLGEHCEPCSRYHQALFMRRHSHQCMACRSINEAHRKRHTEIAELLKKLYLWGGVHGSIVSIAFHESGSSQKPLALGNILSEEDKDNGSDTAIGPSDDAHELILTKRERKDAKNLAKAANRDRVITGQEIDYIHSVLHAKKNEDFEGGPESTAEMEEFEQNLKYNAAIYTSGTKGAVLRSLYGVNIRTFDFSTEMERILNELKLIGFLIKTGKSTGITGKDIRPFDQMLANIKEVIVEDLVWAEKEAMATRMRKAGFLRWANREGVDTVQNRLAQYHWDTGERRTSPVDYEPYGDAKSFENINTNEGNMSTTTRKRDSKEALSHPTGQSGLGPGIPDTRHLHQQGVIIGKTMSPGKWAEHKPLESEVPPRDRPLATLPFRVLKVTNDSWVHNSLEKNTPTTDERTLVRSDGNGRANLMHTATKQTTEAQAYQLVHDSIDESSATRTTPIPNPSRTTQLQLLHDNTNTNILVSNPDPDFTYNLTASVPLTTNVSMHSPELTLPEILTSKASPTKRGRSKDISPRNLSPTPSPTALSHKKAKKQKREEARKLRRRAELEQDNVQTATTVNYLTALVPHAAPTGATEKGTEIVEHPTKEPFVSVKTDIGNTKDVHTDRMLSSTSVGLDDAKPNHSEDLESMADPKLPQPPLAGPTTNSADYISKAQILRDLRKGRERMNKLTVKTYHHASDIFTFTLNTGRSTKPLLATDNDWRKFSSYLEVDALSSPRTNIDCRFANRSLKDCPFHPPDLGRSPLSDSVLVVFPNKEPLILGPVTRSRGEKLLILYDAHFPELRGRIMLIDNEMECWLFPSPGESKRPPPELLREIIASEKGGPAGRLMKQEQDFSTLYWRNSSKTHKCTHSEFTAMNEKVEPHSGARMCYCAGPDPAEVDTSSETGSPDDFNVIECSFKDCYLGRFHAECIHHCSPEMVTKFYCTDCHAGMKKLAREICRELGLKS